MRVRVVRRTEAEEVLVVHADICAHVDEDVAAAIEQPRVEEAARLLRNPAGSRPAAASGGRRPSGSTAAADGERDRSRIRVVENENLSGGKFQIRV